MLPFPPSIPLHEDCYIARWFLEKFHPPPHHYGQKCQCFYSNPPHLKKKRRLFRSHFDMSNVMSKEAALDHWFEPLEEDPKQYIPPGVEIRAGDLTEWRGVDATVTVWR